MTSISAGFAVAASWRSLIAASVDATAAGAPALTRDRAFTAFASAILGALGSPATGTDPASSGSAADSGGSRINDVALALKNSLAGSGGSPDAVGSVLGTIQSALDQASQALSNAGFSSDAIQGFVAQFRNALSDQLDVLASQAAVPAAAAAVAAPPASASAPVAASAIPVPTATTGSTGATLPTPLTAPSSPSTPAASPVPARAAAATAAAPPASGSGAFEADYRLTQSGALELVTTQGDVVRIGFRSSETLAAVGASATGAAGLAAYAAVASYSTSRFSVSVQGSLNADELKAINEVLGQVNTLATQFFSGNVAQAFASAATLGVDPKEIAGLALNLTESVGLTLASVGDGAAPPTAGAAPAAASPPATATDTTGVATAPATAAVPAKSAPATATSPTTGTPQAPDATTPVSVSGGLKSLLDYLQQVLDALGTTTTSGTVSFSAKAKLELLAAAVDTATIAPAEATAADLLKRVAAATSVAPAATAAASPPAIAATAP